MICREIAKPSLKLVRSKIGHFSHVTLPQRRRRSCSCQLYTSADTETVTVCQDIGTGMLSHLNPCRTMVLMAEVHSLVKLLWNDRSYFIRKTLPSDLSIFSTYLCKLTAYLLHSHLPWYTDRYYWIFWDIQARIDELDESSIKVMYILWKWLHTR